MIEKIIIENIENVKNQYSQFKKRDIEISKNSVLLGIRRSGKSYLLYDFSKKYEDDFLYINFEDERLIWFEAKDLDLFIQKYIQIFWKEPGIILLDEIQNITSWEKFVRRLRDNKKDILITWSNAFLFSRDIATTIWWRLQEIEVFPLSFKEYLNFKSVDYDKISLIKNSNIIIKYFWEYLEWGAFLEKYDDTKIEKKKYLDLIYNSVFYRDIVWRYSVKNENGLKLFFKKTAEIVWNEYSFTNIKNKLLNFVKIWTSTLIEYNSYAENSYLLFNISNYKTSFQKREMFRKTYFIDTGILNLFLVDQKPKLLENYVFLELRRKFKEIYYYKQNNFELDFYVPENNILIQVSYSLKDYDTKKREINWLLKSMKDFNIYKGFILTYEEEEEIKYDNYKINVMPAYKYFLWQ